MYTIILTDTMMREPKSFKFRSRAISTEGIIKAIKANKREINECFSWVVNAKIEVFNDGDLVSRGKYKYDVFSGHGDIELRRIEC